MTIPSQQLEVWSHIGAITASKTTYHSIRKCVETHTFTEGVKYDIYLQGSYGNSTNIRGDSDVDVVTELTSSFKPKTSALNDDERTIFSKKYKDSTYFLPDFKKEVVTSLKNYYDENKISIGNKAIKLEGYSGRLNADIIIAIKYRYFWHVYENQNDSYAEGIAFQDKNGVWKAIIKSSHNGMEKEAVATIRQTYSKFSMILKTDESTSQTTMASFKLGNPIHRTLIYTYLCKPLSTSSTSMNIHEGTGSLEILKGDEEMRGYYYSGRGRQNYGDIKLKKEVTTKT